MSKLLSQFAKQQKTSMVNRLCCCLATVRRLHGTLPESIHQTLGLVGLNTPGISFYKNEVNK
jgi:hypothetical protein